MRRVAALAAVTAALFTASGSPAPADSGNTILYGTNGYTDGPLNWTLETAKCSDTVVNSPANGIDARAVPAGPYAGSHVRVRWTAQQQFSPLPAISRAVAYDAACEPSVLSASAAPDNSSIAFAVPSTARLLLLQGNNAVNITFTIAVGP
jgi:hypothetical protein